MPIQTTVVGSYPVPEWLSIYPTQQHLRDATMAVLKVQELAGIEVVADGELYRFDPNLPDSNGMNDYFVSQLDGVNSRFGIADLKRFAHDQGLAYRARPSGVVSGPIGSGTLNLPEAARPLRELTDSRRTKFTLTGPYMLARTLLDRHYGSLRELCEAIADVLAEQVAEVDADVIQLDEAQLPAYPEDAEWAAQTMNRVLDRARGERAVHICFGNYGGQVIHGESAYEPLIPAMDRLNTQHLILELARSHHEELGAIGELGEDKGIGLGVVDIKDNVVETPEEVARRIEAASKLLGEERITYVHPDCGLWMLKRSVADAKMKAMVKGRDLFEGRE